MHTTKEYFTFFFIFAAVNLTVVNFTFAQYRVLAESYAPNAFASPIPEPMTPVIEEVFWIGVSGGVNVVHYKTAPFPILNSEPSCFTAQNGSGIAPILGISYQLPIGFGDNVNFITCEVFYDSKSAKFNTANNTRTDIPTKLNGVEAPGSITTNMTASLSYLLVALGYKYNLMPAPEPVGPGFQLSLNAGIKLLSNFTKTVTISASAGTNAVSNTQNNTVAIDGMNTIRLGLRGQFSYDIPFYSPSFIVTPFVGYDLPLTKVDNTDRAWTASSVYAGIATHFVIGLGY